MTSTQAAQAIDEFIPEPDDPLLECLALVTRILGEPLSGAALCAGLPLVDGRLTPSLAVRAAQAQGYGARALKRPLGRISNLILPAILLLKDGRACVLTRLDSGAFGLKKSATVLSPEAAAGERTVPVGELEQDYSGIALFIQPRPKADDRAGDPPAAPSRFWFWGTLWRFRSYYAEASLAALLVNLLTIATSLFIMNVYDRVVPNNAISTLWVLASGTALAVGFEFAARTLRSHFLDAASRKVDVVLAGAIFQHALGMRMESRPPSAGAFAGNLREFESLRDFFASATLATLTDLPFVLLFSWVVSLIAGPLALVPLVALPVIVLVGLLAQIPLAGAMKKHLKESSLKHGVLVEAVEGMETLKTLNAEGRMQRRWEDYTALTAGTAARTRGISALVMNFCQFSAQLTTIVMVVWGVYLIGEGQLTVGALVASVILAGRALAPLSQLAGLLTRYQHARAALASLDKVMKTPLERPAGRRLLHRPEINGEFELRDVGFAYPGQKLSVLKDLSFHVKPGERVAILGRVGSGKSTLLKLLVGLYPCGSGVIMLDGADIQQIDPVDVRRGVAHLAQEVRLFHGTLRENVALGNPRAEDPAIVAAARVAGLDRMVATHPLGFDMRVGERGEGLSGGQRQAVALARAVLTDPAVMLLDEPTSAMDHATELAVIQELKRFCQGRTIILVTHKPSMLELVERLIVIDGGRAVADGPRDQVLQALARPAQKAPGGGA